VHRRVWDWIIFWLKLPTRPGWENLGVQDTIQSAVKRVMTSWNSCKAAFLAPINEVSAISAGYPRGL